MNTGFVHRWGGGEAIAIGYQFMTGADHTAPISPLTHSNYEGIRGKLSRGQ